MSTYTVTMKAGTTWDRRVVGETTSKQTAMHIARGSVAGLYHYSGGDVTVERDGVPIWRWAEQAEYRGPVTV